ncbi:TPA: PapB/FocB family fimbrial expression transcriptional regulator [Enterobacter hormaechei]|uniref:PapB/FocB family fimbrial expression transcriptional regulator n=1 Tax=Enterobacter cloacae complex TaxID=354276 RepID=UPI0012533F7A|nr:PapB/FocB family fimbrial expression transcriptional regulator [Enterobacter hormaechei]VAL09997.1 Major pilu subunit operon regulatory protein papB [Enterobacter hormaechei]
MGHRKISGSLVPGNVSEHHLRLLMMIRPIKNPAMRNALKDVLIRGVTRKQACEYYNIAQSHFSVKFREMQFINQIIAGVIPHLSDEDNHERDE